MIITNQTITLKRELGRDKYGESIGTEDFTMAARVVNEVNKRPNQAGEEVVTNMTISINTPELIRTGADEVIYSDKFRYTDEFGNETERVPTNIAPAVGFSGRSSHIRVFI